MPATRLLATLMAVGLTAGCGRPTVQPNDAPQGILTVSEAVADIVEQVSGDPQVTALSRGDTAAFVVFADAKDRAAVAGLVVGTEPELAALGVSARPRPLPGAPATTEAGERVAVAVPGDTAYPWLDPSVIQAWLPNLQAALTALTPSRAFEYETRGARYALDLATLSNMMGETIAALPEENRTIAVDAPAAVRAMLEPFGMTVVPLDRSVNTVAEAEAMDTAALDRAIAATTATMVYLAAPRNHFRVAELARASGRPIGLLFTVRPTSDDAAAPGYLGMMRFNVQSLSEGLSAPLELPSPTSP